MAIRQNRSQWDPETEGVELLELTLGGLLDAQAEALGDQDAVVYRYPEIGIDLRLGFSALRDRVNAVAKGLMAIGVGPGDKVAVLATNVPEWLLLELAVPKIGAVLVTVNTNVRRSELEYLLRQAEVHTLVLMDEYRGNAYAATVAELVPEIAQPGAGAGVPLASREFPQLCHVVLLGSQPRPGMLGFERFVAGGEGVAEAALAARQAAVRPDDVSQIQFTSGTTGAPKGAMITHRGTLNNARLFGLRAGFRRGDRMVTAMPFFHTAGNVLDVLGLLVHGGTLVKAIHFEPLKLLELVEQERATILHGVPTMLIAMLQHPRADEFDCSSLRLVVSGGTPIPVPVLEQVKARFGADPVIGFGMTEAGPMVTGTRSADSFELKSATVGLPLPHIALKIVDAAGEVVPLGTPGELLVRTFSVMKGYYKMPEKTSEAIDAEGWLHSGDLATLDAAGYVRIVGRIKDMIIRGGENVYPAEVETFLMRHPAILQAQVVGVPDPYMGEEAAAFIQLRDGMALSEDELRDHCKAQMSRHKLPKYFRFVASFPLTPSGKVKKFELRESVVAELADLAESGKAAKVSAPLNDATLPLLYAKEGGIATFTLNRPASRNALTPELVCRLADAIADFVADPTLRVGIVTGSGDKAFCSGGDLGSMLPLISGDRPPADEWDRRVLEEPFVMAASSLREFAVDKPLIAAINGACLAGGMEMMLGTDIRVAAEHAVFGLPEVRRGVLPFAGSMVRLPRQIGWSAAMELLLVGEAIDATEARRVGLVNHVVPGPEVMGKALELARKIAANGPLAVQRVKHTAVAASGVPLLEGFALEDQSKAIVMASDDAREGPRAFMEKRAPKFTGR